MWARQTLTRLPAQLEPRARARVARPDDPVEHGRPGGAGSSRNSSTVSFSAYVASPVCGTGSIVAIVGQRRHEQVGPRARRAVPRSSPAVTVGPIGTFARGEDRSGVEPGLDRASRATPVSVSPASIARSTGAAPRQRGSSEKWRFTKPSGRASSSVVGRICPNATTTPSSAPEAATSSTISRERCGVRTSMPSSVAAALTGLGSVARPATPATVGLGHDERDVVTGGDERSQRRHRVVRCPEVDQSQGARRSESRSAPRRRRVERAVERAGVDELARRAAPAGPACAGRARAGRARRMPSRWSISWRNTRPRKSSSSTITSLPSRSTPLHDDALGPHDLEREPGHREAPLVVAPLAARLDDLRVDHDLRTLADVVGEQSLLHPDLRVPRGRRPAASYIVSNIVSTRRARSPSSSVDLTRPAA